MVEGLTKNGGIVSNFAAKNNILIIFQIRKIMRYIKENKIDLVHCHLPWAGFVGRIIYKLSGVTVIYSEHNVHDRYHFITRWINKFTFNWQSKVIAVSEEVAVAIQNSIKPKVSVQKILNGVNTDYFIKNEEERNRIRAERGLNKSDVLIGNIAVFRPQKRLKEWIDIFKKVSEIGRAHV